MPIIVRSAEKPDIPLLSSTLGKAFHDDPVMRWVVPCATARARALTPLFAALVRHHYLAGGGVEVAETDIGIGAAALWAPPGRWHESRLEMLRMAPSLWWTLRGSRRAFQTVLQAVERVHPEEHHWYLGMIGSDPEVRGKGLAHALLRSRLDRCDTSGTPAYLESSNPDNVPYYQRFGFQVRGEICSPIGGPSLWAMWRPPLATESDPS
jgi:GNAT superfamily N-acetyltransferase